MRQCASQIGCWTIGTVSNGNDAVLFSLRNHQQDNASGFQSKSFAYFNILASLDQSSQSTGARRGGLETGLFHSAHRIFYPCLIDCDGMSAMSAQNR